MKDNSSESPFFRNYGSNYTYTSQSPLLNEDVKNDRSSMKYANSKLKQCTVKYDTIDIKHNIQSYNPKNLKRSDQLKKYRFFNRTIDNEDISSVKTQNKIIQRHSFVTLLETFDSKRVIILLFLPTLFYCLFYYIALPFKNNSLLVNIEQCKNSFGAFEYRCIIADNSLSIQMLKPINSLGYIQSSLILAKLDHSKQYKMNVMLSSIASSFNSQNIINQQSINVDNYLKTYITKVEQLDPKDINIEIPFDYLALNQYISFRQEFINIELSSSSELFSSSSSAIKIIYQNEYFCIFLAIVSIFSSIFTLYVLYILISYSVDNARYVKNLLIDSNVNQDQYQQSNIGVTEIKDRSLVEFILPEQIIVFFILFFLFIYQDPMGSICILLDYFNVNISNDNIILAVVIMNSTSKFGLIISFISYIDGLKYSKTSTNNSVNKKNKKVNIEDEFWRKNNSLSIVSEVSITKKISTAHSEYQSLSVHHPLSISFLDYIHKKILFLLFSWVTLIVLIIMKYKSTTYENKIYYFANIISPFVFMFLNLTLFIWIIWVFFNTSQKLSKARLITTRFRQISFRSLLFQVNFTLFCILLYFSVMMFSENSIFAIFTYKSISSLFTFLLGWCNYYGFDEFNKEGNNPFGIHCPGFVVFISLISYVLAFSIIPPQKSTDNVQNHSFVSLEKYIPFSQNYILPGKKEAKIIKKINFLLKKRDYNRIIKLLMDTSFKNIKSNTSNPVFCLEIACVLLEISYQTYSMKSDNTLTQQTDKDKEENENSNSVPNNIFQSKNDLIERMGLESVSTFYNKEYATFGFIGQSDNSLVISFRGSIFENWTIDMDFSQIPLPDMKKSKNYFLSIIDKTIDTTTVFNDTDKEEINLDNLNNSVDSYVSVDSLHPNIIRNNSDLELNIINNHNETIKFKSDLTTHQTNELAPLTTTTFDKKYSTYDVCESMKYLGSYIPLLRQSFPRIHSGFWKAYNSIRDEVLTALVTRLYLNMKNILLNQGQDSNSDSFISDLEISKYTNIYFCGHSLGGAIAVLASLDLAINMSTIAESIYSRCILDVKKVLNKENLNLKALLWDPPSISVFTYGCPRIGNPSLVKLVKNYVKNIYRIVVNGDLVTMLPKIPFFYRHIGIPILIDDEALGSITVNPTIIEAQFTKNSTGNISKHSLDVYRTCLENIFDKDEFTEYLKKEYFSLNKSANDNIPDWVTNIT